MVTRLEPIMLLKLPIMLLSSVQNHAHDQQIKHLIDLSCIQIILSKFVLIITCIKYFIIMCIYVGEWHYSDGENP